MFSKFLQAIAITVVLSVVAGGSSFKPVRTGSVPSDSFKLVLPEFLQDSYATVLTGIPVSATHNSATTGSAHK